MNTQMLMTNSTVATAICSNRIHTARPRQPECEEARNERDARADHAGGGEGEHQPATP